VTRAHPPDSVAVAGQHIRTDLGDLVTRLNDLAEAHSDEITELRGRQDALVARVDRATRRRP
jgi:hypothetical protein